MLRSRVLVQLRILVLISLLVLVCGLNAMAEENLLVNGSFEEGSFEYEYLDKVPVRWDWEFWAGQSGSFWVTDEEAYEGIHSVKLVAGSQRRDGRPTPELCHFFQNPVLKPNQTYTFIAYMKPIEGDASLTAIGVLLLNTLGQYSHYYSNERVVIAENATPAQGGVIMEAVEVENGWVRHRIVFTTPARRMQQYQFRVVVWGSEPYPKPDNIAYVDNAQLYEGVVD